MGGGEAVDLGLWEGLLDTVLSKAVGMGSLARTGVRGEVLSRAVVAGFERWLGLLADFLSCPAFISKDSHRWGCKKGEKNDM